MTATTTHTRSGGPALSVDGGGAIVAATVLGRGPVAVVYAGRLAATGAEVAVKVFPDRFDRDTAGRLERERRALVGAVAATPSILAVESVGEYAGDRSSVVTQLCAGSLAGMLTRGALPVSEVLAVGAAAAGALAAAHEAGVVHGGVTPHNVLFRRSGEPVLGDFGLALRERFSRDPMHALEYTAPETLRDDARTTASDLYGLGAVLYAMLTGAPPFPRRTGQAPGERILRVLRDPVPPIQSIPGELSELVSLLLAKDPADRPADAARVAAWFDHVRGRSTAVPPALNPLAPPAAHPDTDFDSFAGRPETAPPQRFPAAPPPVAAPPLAQPRPSAQPLPAIAQPAVTEPTRPASPRPPSVTEPPTPPPANTPAAFVQPGPVAFARPAPPPGRTLVYSVSGQETARKPRRWKVPAAIGVVLVAAAVAAVVLTSGDDGGSPVAQQTPAPTTTTAPETTAAPDIGLEVTKVDDLGDRVDLTWAAEGDLDFSVVVAGEKIDTMVLVANRQREMTVPVDPGRKYCFQIRATDSREIYTSEPVPIRGARCAL
ncbi:serine/threonine protein kinase [Actinophytocola sp. NPDC049390]|uniref:serine/threonine protein kinase n=1 Tax=Actinophytocola sp. NPDC049390 TaxID=3363894 RepID=UPI0037AAC9CF